MGWFSQKMKISDERTWPAEVVKYLDDYGGIFRAWEVGRQPGNKQTVEGVDYDRKVHSLRSILENFTLHGYHCTRLTEREISEISRNGMSPLSVDSLRERVRAAAGDQLISKSFAETLLMHHRAAAINRAGQIWFCFFPPRLGGESGIECFLRYWGGESLYKEHQDEKAIIDPRLGAIGIPCLVEAEVPISSQDLRSSLANVIARRYLRRRGFCSQESSCYEGFSTKPISGSSIQRIIRFPSVDFMRLTGCNHWRQKLK